MLSSTPRAIRARLTVGAGAGLVVLATAAGEPHPRPSENSAKEAKYAK
jgi:hypothetical protein